MDSGFGQMEFWARTRAVSRLSSSEGLTSLTAMMRRSGVAAVWRVKPARVVYGHFYFSMCEALLRTESGSGGGPVRTDISVA
jgi:hypothetical protein